MVVVALGPRKQAAKAVQTDRLVAHSRDVLHLSLADILQAAQGDGVACRY